MCASAPIRSLAVSVRERAFGQSVRNVFRLKQTCVLNHILFDRSVSFVLASVKMCFELSMSTSVPRSKTAIFSSDCYLYDYIYYVSMRWPVKHSPRNKERRAFCSSRSLSLALSLFYAHSRSLFPLSSFAFASGWIRVHIVHNQIDRIGPAKMAVVSLSLRYTQHHTLHTANESIFQLGT